MRMRLKSPLTALLALWVGIGVLTAGFLSHAPELHRALHSQFNHDHAGHHHDPGSSDKSTDNHHCLIDMLGDGGADSATASPPVTISFTAPISLRIQEADARERTLRGLLPPGRAPPLA